jgi:large subunit ribosomal protein L21
MDIAVIKTGGKQYLVKEGLVLTVEKLTGKEGDTIEFDALLTDDGSDTKVGTPVSGKVSGTIVEHDRAKKVVVVKYKAKSRYYKKRGHRQPFSKVKIGKI